MNYPASANPQVKRALAGWLVLACTTYSAVLQPGDRRDAGAPRLAGIVNLPSRKCALLEVPGTHFPGPRLILDESQREGKIELLKIDPAANKVTVRISAATQTGSEDVIVSLPKRDGSSVPNPTLAFDDVDVDSLLALYAEFAGRTILRPGLPKHSFTLAASPSNQAEAALVIEKALAEQELISMADGERFLMVLPKALAANARPHSSALKSKSIGAQHAPGGPNQSGNDELIPEGGINFVNVDLFEAAKIYVEYLGRKLERNPTPGVRGFIRIKTQTPLTREEACYALETLFNWQGAKLVPASEDLIRLVPISSSLPGR